MLRLIAVLLFVMAFLAIRFVPWWALLLSGITLLILGKFFATRLILYLISWAFSAKGKVLRGATAVVHRVTPVPKPQSEWEAEQDQLNNGRRETDLESSPADMETLQRQLREAEDWDEDDEEVARDYYEIEVTITPIAQSGPFSHWEYTELTLVKPDQSWRDFDDSCRVESIDLVRDGIIVQHADGSRVTEFDDELDADDDGTKVVGAHRLKMVVGIQQGIRDLAFNYYFVKFGELHLPA